jgi:hypothetical protein
MNQQQIANDIIKELYALVNQMENLKNNTGHYQRQVIHTQLTQYIEVLKTQTLRVTQMQNVGNIK